MEHREAWGGLKTYAPTVIEGWGGGRLPIKDDIGDGGCIGDGGTQV